MANLIKDTSIDSIEVNAHIRDDGTSFVFITLIDKCSKYNNGLSYCHVNKEQAIAMIKELSKIL